MLPVSINIFNHLDVPPIFFLYYFYDNDKGTLHKHACLRFASVYGGEGCGFAISFHVSATQGNTTPPSAIFCRHICRRKAFIRAAKNVATASPSGVHSPFIMSR
jgi:hypothetical protein